jgi:membrane protein
MSRLISWTLMSRIRFLRALLRALVQHRVKDLSAELAFWSLLSLFPFCIFLLTIVSYFPALPKGPHGMDGELIALLGAIMPPDAAVLFARTLREVLGSQHGILLGLSLVGALWSAAGGMGSTANALNLAFGAAERRSWIGRRATFLLVTLGAALLSAVATAALLVGPNVVRTLWKWFLLPGHFPNVWPWLRWPVVAAALLTLLGGLYHFLPDVRRPFRWASPGALVALVLWAIASAGFRIYVGHVHSFAHTYGRLGAPVILIVWLYLSAFTLILGGEINALLDARRRAHIG